MTEPHSLLAETRQKKPLVHFITNYVTVNDCANMTLACGGAPVMADELAEVEQIVSLSAALVLNIGTVNERTLHSMIRAGRRANQIGIPVIFDPVGAGASDFRNSAVRLIQKEVRVAVIKGNISEIKFIFNGITSTQGVDASAGDIVSDATLGEALYLARTMADMTGAVVAITGPIDIVADARNGYALRNGSPCMATVTGTGCMSAAVAGCFLGTRPEQPLDAVIAATTAMGVCGELAEEATRRANGGNCFFRNALIDTMGSLTDEVLAARGNVEKLA